MRRLPLTGTRVTPMQVYQRVLKTTPVKCLGGDLYVPRWDLAVKAACLAYAKLPPGQKSSRVRRTLYTLLDIQMCDLDVPLNRHEGARLKKMIR